MEVGQPCEPSYSLVIDWLLKYDNMIVITQTRLLHLT